MVFHDRNALRSVFRFLGVFVLFVSIWFFSSGMAFFSFRSLAEPLRHLIRVHLDVVFLEWNACRLVTHRFLYGKR